jgi:hypothetical protein
MSRRRLILLKPQPALPDAPGVDVGIAPFFFHRSRVVVPHDDDPCGITNWKHLVLCQWGVRELLRAHQHSSEARDEDKREPSGRARFANSSYPPASPRRTADMAVEDMAAIDIDVLPKAAVM